MKAGLAFNPQTEIPENMEELIQEADLILCMTVQPGFGG